MSTVLVQAAIAEYHRLGGLNNRHLFLIVLEAGSLRSECQHGQVLVRTSFLVSDSHLLAVSPPGRERERSSIQSIISTY